MVRCPRASGRSFSAIIACLAATVSVAACTDAGDSGANVAAGGTSAPGAGGGAGGSSGTATSGAAGASGSPASAGASIGGAPSSAGSPSAGSPNAGSPNSAGAPSSGGAATTGGSAGSGGAGGAAGGASGSAGAAGAVSTCPTVPPLTGGTKYCSNKTGSAGGGYSYELWAEGTGSGCMTVYGVGANFGASWSNVEDFLARIGLSFDQTKTPAQIGTISADFAETKTGNDGLVYVGIYGWTVNPLREYYILDDWGSTKPAGIASDGTPRDNVGKITVDGATYDVWKKTRTNKPAITGDNKTFDQYFSIRQTARQCGHISVSEHFSKWIGLGLQLGNLYEAKLLLEAQDSTGSIEFTTATVRVEPK